MKKKKIDDLEQYKDIQVADMNVEGMPWYKKKEEGTSSPENPLLQQEPLPLKATWKLIGTSMFAALFIGGIFLLAFFLFLLFCTNVWLG